MDKNKFWHGGRLFNTTSPRLSAPTQRKACPQDGRPNETQGTFESWAPQLNAIHIRKLGAPMHVHNANARHVCKLGDPTHIRNANARHVRTSATWPPQRNARHVRNLGAQTQRNASSQDGCPNGKLIRNENVHTREHLAKRRAGGLIRTNFCLEVDFLIRPHPGWAPQRNKRRVRKMGTQTQHKARPQVGRPNAMQGMSTSWAPQRNARHVRKLGAPRHVRTSTNWAPQRNARHVRKMVAQTQNSSATKTSTQGSTRLKDELEDG
jgi:hypothetical protein